MRRLRRSAALAAAATLGLVAAAAAQPATARPKADTLPGGFKHLVVIYEENHSFDNLYGRWGRVNGQRVAGLGSAPLSTKRQVAQDGSRYRCLLQVDLNLKAPSPLSSRCEDPARGVPESHFGNGPFTIDRYIRPRDRTCPEPGVAAPDGVLENSPGARRGGCTRDLVHRFYQEQYQLDGGRQDRYVTGSDAVGLTMGTYATKALPIYRYLHAPGHPRYAIEDRFFQAAFGGSFLNHQWLVAAATPEFYDAPADGGANDQHSIVDPNGMPTSYPLYKSPLGSAAKDGALTQACPAAPGVTCGDWAVNTIQPAFQPYAPNTAAARRLPPQRGRTIGDRLSAKGIDWAWYSGGWSNAAGAVNAPGWTNGDGPTCSDSGTASGATYPYCPDKLFQFHHQPL